MTFRRWAGRGVVSVFLGLALCVPIGTAAAAEDEVAEMMRAIRELQAQNRALARRLELLEAEKSEREGTPRPAVRVPKTKKAQSQPKKIESDKSLERRVKELEDAKTAQEDATRSIIRDSLSTLGSKINESVALGGAIEILGSRTSDYGGTTTDKLAVNTVELDFEIQANDWALGSLVLEYTDGTDDVFTTTTGFDRSVDRINLDTASVTIGDTRRFPLFFTVGQVVLPFGTSTGVARADVLSIETPLTIEVFETKKTSIELGFAFPTPALAPPPPAVVVPPVRPLVIAPLFGSLGRLLGYKPPPKRPTPPTPTTPTPTAPPIYGGVSFFEGSDDFGSDRSFADNINGQLGYRTQGHCGRPYSELRETGFCPWSIDFSVNYNSSIFESQFLETKYRSFLGAIGRVPAMAASVKGSAGPVSFVGEWNGTLESARFTDNVGKKVDIRPQAWQVALGYQFDWNPWVEGIGDQGTFLGIGFSQSHDLAGVNGASRDGSVPKRRLTLTAGEWVMGGAKLLIEYSHNWGYSERDGGPGGTASGILGTLTYVW